jgi:hypothetical protein
MPEAFEKMLQDPKATDHMNEIFTIVKQMAVYVRQFS